MHNNTVVLPLLFSSMVAVYIGRHSRVTKNLSPVPTSPLEKLVHISMRNLHDLSQVLCTQYNLVFTMSVSCL
jgi:hypothetical protein